MYWHLLSLKGLKKKACNKKRKKKREERIVKVIINNIACTQGKGMHVHKKKACAQTRKLLWARTRTREHRGWQDVHSDIPSKMISFILYLKNIKKKELWGKVTPAPGSPVWTKLNYPSNLI